MVKHKKNVSKNLTTKLENLILSAKFLTQFFKHFLCFLCKKLCQMTFLQRIIKNAISLKL